MTIGRSGSSLVYRLLWWACVPFLPILQVQGKRLRKRVPRLPEADGPFEGEVGDGSGPELTVTVLGESSVAGVGVRTQGQGLAISVARALGDASGRHVRWQAVGMTGATMSKVRRDLVGRLSMAPGTLVVVALGINDTIRLTRQGRWIAGARQLTETLIGLGAGKVVFSSVPPLGHFPALPNPLRAIMGLRSRLLDARLRESLGLLAGAHYCQIQWPDPQDLMADDGFHPSAQGYLEWGRQLGVEVASMVEPPQRPMSLIAE